MQLIVDNRTGVHNHDTKSVCVGQQEALQWLSRLNGSLHTLLRFERQDGWCLMLGGGPLKYIITLEDGTENLTFHNINGNQSVVVELCAGGQFGEFPENFCATHDQAAWVIALFFRGNERQANWI